MSFWKEGKEFFSQGIEQLIFQKEIIKLKLKIYGLQKKIEADFFNLGQLTYDYIQNKQDKLNEKEDLKKLIEDVNIQKKSILELNEEIKKMEGRS